MARSAPYAVLKANPKEGEPLGKVKKRALLLVNPVKRRGGRSDRRRCRAAAHTGGLDITIEPFDASAGNRLRHRHQAARKRVDLIIPCGGDGTMPPARWRSRNAALPRGIVPLGTANDLARTLGIPMDLSQAADVILAGNTRTIVLGTVNGYALINVASIMGFPPILRRSLHPTLKRRFGRFGYALAAAKVLEGAAFHGNHPREGPGRSR